MYKTFASSSLVRASKPSDYSFDHLLQERFRYLPGDIVVLTDDSKDPKSKPTRDNIVRIELPFLK